jgi:hypothetical protein
LVWFAQPCVLSAPLPPDALIVSTGCERLRV